jgi:hypothetical protein
MTDGERRDPRPDAVSLSKNDAGQQPLDFDPYRFGRPEHPIPPEYAPPGYSPPPAPHRPPANQGWQGYYGAPAPPPYPPDYPRPRTGNGKAIAALVLGIVSIVLCWLSLLDLVPIVLALVFGFLGRSDAAKWPQRGGRGMAIAGITCALVGALLAGLFTAWVYTRIRTCNEHYDVSSPQYRICVQQRV